MENKENEIRSENAEKSKDRNKIILIIAIIILGIVLFTVGFR